MSREAMQQASYALDACSTVLKYVTGMAAHIAREKAEQVIEELTAALAEPVPEPVAWQRRRVKPTGNPLDDRWITTETKQEMRIEVEWRPLFAAPPAQPAPSVPPMTQRVSYMNGYAAGRAQSHAVDGCPEVPLPTSERGETLQYRYGEMLKHGQSCYAAGRASLVPLLEQALEALDCAQPCIMDETYDPAITSLEAALKEIKP